MKILHRYVFLSVGGAALFGAAVFAFILVAANAVRDILERLASGQLSVEMAVKMVGLLVPFTLSFAAPMGLLIGILVILGRMSAQNEMVAIKSAGISLWRISLGILILGALGTVLCAFVNNYYAPVARTQYRKMLSDVVQEAPLRFIVPGRFVRDFPGYVIFAGDREGGRLRNVMIWVLGADRQADKFLQAQQGSITYDRTSNALILDVWQATGEAMGSSGSSGFAGIRPQAVIEHASFTLPMGQLMSAKSVDKPKPAKLSNMSLGELVGVWRDARGQMSSSEPDSEAYREALVMKTRAGFHISRNFAFAYGTFALCMIAIPLGIRVGRKESYANMAVAVALGLVYFFLVFMAGWAEKTPAACPALLVWLPNVGFQALSVVLMRRANRH